MIYKETEGEYRVKFYTESKNGKTPILEYLKELPEKEEAKIVKYKENIKNTSF